MKLEFDGYSLNGEILAGATILEEELDNAKLSVITWQGQLAIIKAVTADPIVIGNFEERLTELKEQENLKRQCLIQVLTMDLINGIGRRQSRFRPYAYETNEVYHERMHARIAELQAELDA